MASSGVKIKVQKAKVAEPPVEVIPEVVPEPTVRRPQKPHPQDDPTGAKFVEWVKADMVWKQHPKRQI